MIKKRLIELLSDSKKYVFLQVIYQWLALVCQIIIIFQISGLLAGILAGDLVMDRLPKALGIILVCMALRFVFDRLNTRASYAASVNVKRILREKIYEKLLRLGASYRQQVTTAEVVQMSVEGVEQLEVYFGKYLSQLFYSLLAPVTLFIVLCRVNMKASLVLLICVPLIPVSIVVVQKIAKRLLNKYWGIYTELGDSFLENLQGLTTLKIYQADREKAMEMDAESERFRQVTMKVLTMQLNSTSVMDIVAYGGAAVGMVVVLQQFFHGQVGFAGALTIILLASEFFLPLRLLGSYFHIAMNGMAASDRMFDFLDLSEGETGSLTLTENRYDLVTEGLTYSYTEDKEILHGVDMHFPSGGMVSIVGESGCGKSTIAGILTMRNQGYGGLVYLETPSGDKLPLNEVQETSLMTRMTRVTHESYLFKGTVRDNLILGNPRATEEDMWQALAQVNLEEFLRNAQGLDTLIAEKGANISGGQKQRLALARALLHDTPIYIFDEATSNIDMESEEMIMNVVKELAKTKTVILISHRLGNVVDSACIYMLKDGVIAQQGSHEALMKEEGPYRDLYLYQQELESYSQEVGA